MRTINCGHYDIMDGVTDQGLVFAMNTGACKGFIARAEELGAVLQVKMMPDDRVGDPPYRNTFVVPYFIWWFGEDGKLPEGTDEASLKVFLRRIDKRQEYLQQGVLIGSLSVVNSLDDLEPKHRIITIPLAMYNAVFTVQDGLLQRFVDAVHDPFLLRAYTEYTYSMQWRTQHLFPEEMMGR